MSGLLRVNQWEREVDIATLARQYNVTIEWLQSRSRKPFLVRARREIARELKKLNYSEKQIAELLNRDRTTIYHYL